MKTGIHPNYNETIEIVCNSCKTAYIVGSTADSMQVEVCTQCHPHYTGKSGTLVDTENKVRDYMERLKAANSTQVVRKRQKMEQRRSSRVETIDTTKKLTLRDMLRQTQQ